MEKSQRTFSLSSWNMDASPSRALTTSTFVETREVRLWVMVQLLIHLLFGSTDPFQSGSSKKEQEGAGPASMSSNEADWPGNIFLPVFILVARCPIPCFVVSLGGSEHFRKICVVSLVNVKCFVFQMTMPTSKQHILHEKCVISQIRNKTLAVPILSDRYSDN